LINKNHLCGTFLCHSANNFTFMTYFLSICFFFPLATNRKKIQLLKTNKWKSTLNIDGSKICATSHFETSMKIFFSIFWNFVAWSV
jgi:hypothetical protein